VRPDCGGYRVSVDVTNTGNRTGADVAQLYVGDPAATGDAMTRKPVIAARLALAGVLASTVLASTAAITLPAVAVPANTALASTAPAAPAASAHPGPGLVVRTDRGLVEGMNAEGTDQFLGTHFASPLVGSRSGAAPRPAARWAGIRAATSYGGRCAQLASGNGPRADNEDCLYLNVYTPPGANGGATRASHDHRGLPVLVMIHGGGLTTGAGDQHDGSLIVTTDHIIVVSINYRLGPLGFLTVPGLGTGRATAGGNYGLLDQEAALRWVRGNVAAFGGDPGKVTIAGESAGGWSVCALLSSPPARGLFRGAIMESGSCYSQSPATAQAAGLAFAKQAGCPDPATAAACLRALPESTLLDASSSYSAAFTYGGPELPAADASAVASGHYAHVPLLIGENHNEGRTFAQGFTGFTQAQADALITSLYGSRAPDVLARYPWASYPSPYTAAYQIGDIWTDSGFLTGIGGCPAQTLAGQFASSTRTYMFQFDDLHAPGLTNDHPGYQWGAGHAMELAYLWPSFNNGFSLYDELTPAQLQLSRQMVRYWGAFVATGAPQVHGQPAWPRYASGRLMSLRPGDQSQAISAVTYGAEHQCSFWNAG
jgi:carboxylesterase type B